MRSERMIGQTPRQRAEHIAAFKHGASVGEFKERVRMRRAFAAALYFEAGVMREERRWRLECGAPGAGFYYDRMLALANAAERVAL